MIIQMKKYTFLVFHRDYETFLTQLRDLGVVDITLKSAGVIENDEALQAALQHEDELRRLLKQGAPDQLIQERANIEQRIAEAGQEAEKAAVWGDFDSARIQALKEAGYTLRFFACPEKTYREEWGIKVAEKEGKTYFVVVDNSITPNIDNSELIENATELPQPEKSAAQWRQETDHLKGLLAAADARIEAWKIANLDRLQQELQEARQQIDWQRVQLSTDKLADGSLCLIEGFCPIENEPELNAMLAASYVGNIVNGKKRNPSRDALISICLAIGTTVDEVQYLLRYGGQAPLYVRRKRDVVIWFGFMKHMRLEEVDEKLRERGLKPLIKDL